MTTYTNITSKYMATFLPNNIICKHGTPHELISDQGSYLRKYVAPLIKKYKTQHHKWSLYRL